MLGLMNPWHQTNGSCHSNSSRDECPNSHVQFWAPVLVEVVMNQIGFYNRT
jgi:hypothetical protein